MARRKKIYEGKAKILYEGPERIIKSLERPVSVQGIHASVREQDLIDLDHPGLRSEPSS